VDCKARVTVKALIVSCFTALMNGCDMHVFQFKTKALVSCPVKYMSN